MRAATSFSIMPTQRKKPSKSSRLHTRVGRFAWAHMPEKTLLDVKLCELGLTIENTWLERPIRQLNEELEARGLRLKPHLWLSEDWFSPDGIPGIAIPFYLAHPRLMQLERKQMLEAEGSNLAWCMKILRHETGHALQHAFRLHRRKRWQEVFGKSSQPYPDYYRPRPQSRDHVLHLYLWYAQSHPDEDFAETFAVWLRPRSQWRRRYVDWPALRKLEYVDELMAELAGSKPPVRTRATVDPLRKLNKTLRQYYEDKRSRYSDSSPDIFDRDLMRLFSNDPGDAGCETASAFLRRNRRAIRRRVARWTGEHQFTLDEVLRDMIGRARELRLRAAGDTQELIVDFAILLTVRTMQYLYTSREWHPL